MKSAAHIRKKNQRGSVIVETALVVVAFMFLLGAVLDLSNYLHVRSKIQHAVSQAARYAITGNQLDDPDNSGSLLSREASIAFILERYTDISFEPSDIDLYVVNADGSTSSGLGFGGDIILVRVRHEMTLITPGLSKLFDDGVAKIRCSTRLQSEQFTYNRWITNDQEVA